MIHEEKMPPFSIKARLRSFKYAFEGFSTFLYREHNAAIHFVMTIIAISAGMYFHISSSEAIAITIAIAAVWSAELFNTAIEKLCDMVSKEIHPSIKFIKDVSAAAVLVVALAALITGAIVFIPKILS